MPAAHQQTPPEQPAARHAATPFLRRRKVLVAGGLGAVGLGGTALALNASASPTPRRPHRPKPSSSQSASASPSTSASASPSTSASASPSTSASASPSPSASTGAATTVAGQALVQIPANTTFTFTTSLASVAGAGESSPIKSAYWLGAYQVTNAQYARFVDATGTKAPSYWNGGSFPIGKDDHPVLCVSYTNAQAYCDYLTSLDNSVTFRLPTEAEWENAARGPDATTYPWGDSAGTTYASGTLTSPFNYNGVCASQYLANEASTVATYNNSESTRYGESEAIAKIISVSSTGGVNGWVDHDNYTGFIYTDVFDALTATGGNTTPVGSLRSGAGVYGAYDLAGNAFEWTSSIVTAVNGAEAGQSVNAVRGGSWYSTSPSCKTSFRGEGRSATGNYISVGFRVAATAN